MKKLSEIQKNEIIITCIYSDKIEGNGVKAFAKSANMAVYKWKEIIDEFQLFFLNPKYDQNGFLIIRNLKHSENLDRHIQTHRLPIKTPYPEEFPTVSQFSSDQIENMRKVVWNTTISDKVKYNMCLRAYEIRLNFIHRRFQEYRNTLYHNPNAKVKYYDYSVLAEPPLIAEFTDLSTSFVYKWEDQFFKVMSSHSEKDMRAFGIKCGLKDKTEPRGILQTLDTLHQNFVFDDLDQFKLDEHENYKQEHDEIISYWSPEYRELLFDFSHLNL